VGDERQTLRALLQYQRESFVRKIAGIDGEQAETSLVASGTSLVWLANHMADAEDTWVLRRFGRRPAGEGGAGPPAATVSEALDRYRRIWKEADALIDGASLDDNCEFDDQGGVNLRWIVVHLLEETARHAGHADILRELIDGETGR
jgi:hypothetical protein